MNTKTELKILTYPNDCLLKVSEPVNTLDNDLLNFCDNLIYTAKRTQNCAGLAAPQVGVNKRIIVVFFEKKKPLLMINPQILEPEEIDGVKRPKGTHYIKEGCLSFPGVWRGISRPVIVGLQYQDRNMKIYRQHVTGFFSSLVQHEVDHLDGIVFTQRKAITDYSKEPQRG